MRTARVFVNKNLFAGILTELDNQAGYTFEYVTNYQGPPISLTMPVVQAVYEFKKFPPFFEGVLPEGAQLEGLLRYAKLDRYDYFGQLMAVGEDLVGAVSVQQEIKP